MSSLKLYPAYLIALQSRISEVQTNLPELPWQTHERLKRAYGLSDKNIEILLKIESVKDVPYDGRGADVKGSIVSYFDALCQRNNRDPSVVFNWFVLLISKPDKPLTLYQDGT
jgi:aspartyl-tRNA(Asn)/glutamyl-tRNA(Gln) amidotransferase subunit B